ARGFSPTVDRPLWLQEVGAPRSILGESDVPWFLRRTVETALDCPQLWGVTWWCSHDVSTELADFPPLEHTLGLFDSAGRLKDAGAAFRDAIAAAREQAPPAPRGRAIDFHVGPDPLLDRSSAAPGGSVFEAWMDASRAGDRPTDGPGGARARRGPFRGHPHRRSRSHPAARLTAATSRSSPLGQARKWAPGSRIAPGHTGSRGRFVPPCTGAHGPVAQPVRATDS